MPRISEDVRASEKDLVALRRDLHQNPELSWSEERTPKKVAE